MDTMIAPCGTNCAECEAYKATLANDNAAIERIAGEWGKTYNIEIKPEHVWCDGCMAASERKCAHCAECDVRLCAIEQNVPTCAHCKEYPCNKLEEYFKQAPVLKENLEKVRKEFMGI
jgi:hypothetical protein